MNKQLQAFPTAFFLLGLLAWLIALLMIYVDKLDAPNSKTAFGSLGFAVAGGLCFVSSAIAATRAERLTAEKDRGEPGTDRDTSS
jgi:hypothetical protein